MHGEKGFSLIEVLISMLLMMSGLLALGHTMGNALKANYRTSQEARVMAYALQKAEALRTVSFTHSDLTNGAHSDTPASGFTRSWTVATAGDLKTITLTLTRPIPGQAQPVRVVLGLQRLQ
jgi:prepilin-type N-terminal cleavage/methylation domain-containing protein